MDSIRALLVADCDIASVRALEEWTYQEDGLLHMGIALGPLAAAPPGVASEPEKLLGDVSVVLEHLENITCRMVYVASSRDAPSLRDATKRLPRMTPHSMNVQHTVLPLAPGLNVTGYTPPDLPARARAGSGGGFGLSLGLEGSFWSALFVATGFGGGSTGGAGHRRSGSDGSAPGEAVGALDNNEVAVVDALVPPFQRHAAEGCRSTGKRGTPRHEERCGCILATSLPEGSFAPGGSYAWRTRMSEVYNEGVIMHVLAPLGPARPDDAASREFDDGKDPRGSEVPQPKSAEAGPDRWDQGLGPRQAVTRIGDTVCVWPGSLYRGEFAIVQLQRQGNGWDVVGVKLHAIAMERQ